MSNNLDTKDDTIITDWAGNQYPASALNEQETPGWDPHGAKKDRAWQAVAQIAREVAAELPVVGKRVTIYKGRKHKGKTGVCIWRGKDQFAGRQYGSDMQQAMGDAMGFRDRIGVRTDDGEKFFVPLRYAVDESKK